MAPLGVHTKGECRRPTASGPKWLLPLIIYAAIFAVRAARWGTSVDTVDSDLYCNVRFGKQSFDGGASCVNVFICGSGCQGETEGWRWQGRSL